ncbi:MAG: hypothetical protein WC340_08025 [Kiritimatiellia bacterium]
MPLIERLLHERQLLQAANNSQCGYYTNGNFCKRQTIHSAAACVVVALRVGHSSACGTMPDERHNAVV